MLLCSGLQALLTKKAKPLSTTISILLAQKTILMSFTVENWSESYVHMPSVFNPEDFYKTETPILIFDKDSSGNEESITLDITLIACGNLILLSRISTDLHLITEVSIRFC